MSLFAGASIKHIFSLPPKLASHPQKAEQPLPKGCLPLRLPLHLPHSLPLLAVCFTASAAVSTVLLAGYLIALLFARLRYSCHSIPASLAVTPPLPTTLSLCPFHWGSCCTCHMCVALSLGVNFINGIQRQWTASVSLAASLHSLPSLFYLPPSSPWHPLRHCPADSCALPYVVNKIFMRTKT